MVTVYILLTVIITAYITLKAVHLGLKWQIETKNNNVPTMPNPVVEHIEKRVEQQEIKKQEAQTLNILNEWFVGDGGEKR